MPISTLDELRSGLRAQRDQVSVTVAANTVIAGRPFDLWRATVPTGAVPTTAVVPTAATLGAIEFANAGAGLRNLIIGARMNAQSPGVLLICDRLSHQGGLSGTATGAQTTNLPTAAITRGTGVGVWIGLTIYTQIGTTATTVSASYTNTVPTAGRTTPLVVIGGTAFREANRMILLPWQEGDVGVNSVESVTLTATTGTVGAFGVTLFRPLLAVHIEPMSGVVSAGGIISGFTGGGMPEVPNDACLFGILISASTTGALAGALLVDEVV